MWIFGMKYLKTCALCLSVFLVIVMLLAPQSVGAALLSQKMANTVNSYQTPSSYSASSSLENFGPNEASGIVFDSKGDDSSRAWCPQSPIKDDVREWLQLEFDGLKVIDLLITWGLSSKKNHFVPYFFLRYERGDGHWHDFISHNGTRIITANHDHTNPKTISLSPPITARRIRIVPYRRDSPQFMCLKLSVLGYNFDESLVSYEIPEGDVYRSGSSWASLNDSSYDGVRHYSKRDPAKRNRLSGGLGVLVDRQIYAGGEIGKALVEPFSLRTSPHEKHQTVSGLVGWFCRSGLPLSVVLPPCQSRNVTLLFTFNSIRQFTELRIHALNSFEENIAVFREALVQFSIGGQFFDHYAPSIHHVHPLNVSSTQPTWVVIPLHGRVGRFVRISLTFQSDWIILSEVVFNSTLITMEVDEEKIGDASLTPALSVMATPKPTLFGDQMANPANETNHQKGGTTPVPIPQPKSSGEGQTDLSLIIGCVCVVGLVLVVSIFVFVLCRMCHSGSRGNRALLGKVPIERGSDAGDCSGSNSNSGRKTKALDTNNGMVSGGGGGDGRFTTFGGPGAFCLANTMAAGEIPSSNIPVDMYSAFNGNDGMLQTLHLMQQQQQQQQTASGYDSTLRPLLQNFSAAGFATLGSNGAPPSMFQVPPPPPPPPDQPLPPLPPITPSSGTSGTQQHHQRPSSTINPYAASSAVSIFANGGNGTTMITSTHTDGSMAEYASASLISGQGGYSMRPSSIHGANSGLLFTSQPNAYPSVQTSSGQDVFLQPTTMLVGTSLANGNMMNTNGVFPVMVSCSSSFGDGVVPSFSNLPSHSKNGLFDTLKSIDTLPPHEEIR